MTPVAGLLAQAIDTPSILYQYGAIGVVLLGAAYAVKALFAREVQALERERERADRMEAEIRRLNAVIQDKFVPVLSAATKTISEALSDQRRRG